MNEEKLFIRRDIFQDLKSHLAKKEITLIVGPRQAGKTTLMMLLKEYLESVRKKTVFLSLDFENDQKFFSSQNALIEKLKLEFGNNEGYVFIDEIQRKEDAGVFLKGLYDMSLPYKFIVSGSGSVELKEKVHESLAGRKAMFEVFPVSFREFVNFKTGYKYDDKLADYFTVEKSANGLDFEAIGTVDGAGNSSTVHSYSFTDEFSTLQLSNFPLVYYRLKQIDYDGKYQYSNVISVDLTGDENNLLTVFPNAASDKINLEVFSVEAGIANVEIIDAIGRVLVFNTHPINSGKNYIPVSIINLSKGLYFIRTTGRVQTWSKFIKE